MINDSKLTNHEIKESKKMLRKAEKAMELKKRSAQKTKKNIILYFGIIAVLFVVIGIIYFLAKPKPIGPGKFDELAKCITASGAKMYGTEWCSHCRAQKALFGNSFQYIDYIDCDAKKGSCNAAGITGYPTWIFSNGERQSGTTQLNSLAQKTGCEIQ